MKKIFLICFFIFAFSACERETELRLPTEKIVEKEELKDEKVESETIDDSENDSKENSSDDLDE